ncbi:hypothetical protein HYV91_01690 [Candidatus Wolfebacteria bacterium]|nr:hypothetical protein [Candidatus Wolfebacteria bacterium]
MVDLFEALRRFETVEKVSYLYPNVVGQGAIDFFFFVCPARKPFRLNAYGTGFTTAYREGVTPSSLERVKRVSAFLSEFEKKVTFPFSCRCIFASADALILFPIPIDPPSLPSEVAGFPVVSNYDLVAKNSQVWARLMRDKPWEKVPERISNQERERFSSLFWSRPPANLIREFIDRSFAGFALDGILARQGCFGSNPVLLGVEGEGVAILQNAGLSKPEWLPVALLK